MLVIDHGMGNVMATDRVPKCKRQEAGVRGSIAGSPGIL